MLLKRLFFFSLLLSFLGTNSFAQNLNLKITSNTASENKTIDSLTYQSIHKNAKEIIDEISKTSEKLYKLGYIDHQILKNTKTNDSTYSTLFQLNNKTKFIHIYIGSKKDTYPLLQEYELKNHNVEIETIKELLEIDKNKDSIILPYTETESFLNNSLRKLEQDGFAFAKLKLVNLSKNNNNLYADLHFDSGQQRLLDAIVVQTRNESKRSNFPEGHLKQINRKYLNRTFNQALVLKIRNDFEKFRFVSQLRNPEILFTKDTTKVYIYLEKRKSNSFDGVIGFSNTDKDKLTFNGYLDLNLENTLKAGEHFSLFWKSDGNNQKTFKTNIELPYIFKSTLGLKAQLHIFKQDSIFQNTKTAIDLGYFIDYNTRIYIGHRSTESSDIQNTNSSSISDYTNVFFTANLDYSKLDYQNGLFPTKTTLQITIGTGKRSTTDLPETAGTSKQTSIDIDAKHNFYINPKNCLNINYQNNFLKSDNYITNELYRFGGINSIRGFEENSLQANFMTALITEYRYILSQELYVHTILDYGYYEDKSTTNKGSLLGIGAGVGLLTKNGLLKIALTTGKTANQDVDFSNAIVSLKYNLKF